MRLICPNCEAQYEVEDNAIPAEGRDVQCSNCGHAWFQAPVVATLDASAETATPAKDQIAGDQTKDDPVKDDPAKDDPVGEDPAAPGKVGPATARKASPSDVPSEAPPEREAAEDGVSADGATVRTGEGAGQPDMAPPDQAGPEVSDSAPPQRRTLDESLLAVLKEEAEREAAARRAEARPLETQTDLGLEDMAAVAPRDRKPPKAAAEPQAESDAALQTEDRDVSEHDEAEPAVVRRDLLPDIEEINSSLSADQGGVGDDASGTGGGRASRSAARSGFALVMVAGILLAAVYFAAPRIVAQFPASHDAMSAYVAQVDQWRGWLDNMVKRKAN